MIKTLLSINEDLPSSIALRYTGYLHQYLPLALFVAHVEKPEEEQIGTGWVRRTWEDGVATSGKRLIDRMLRTEHLECPLAGRPKVFVGDPNRELVYELRSGTYDLFIEGYLDVGDQEAFFARIDSRLYRDMPCAALVVKNLSLGDRCALLCADSVDPVVLVQKSMRILKESRFTVDVIYFKFKEDGPLAVLDRNEGGANLAKVESLLAQNGRPADQVRVLLGPPEQVGEALKEYAFVASTLPNRRSMRMGVLAESPASVLLVH